MRPIEDGYYVEKRRSEVEYEVSAVIKLVMSEMERLAGLDPSEASEPIEFNQTRQRVIKKIWNLSKECIRYGAISVQRDEHSK